MLKYHTGNLITLRQFYFVYLFGIYFHLKVLNYNKKYTSKINKSIHYIMQLNEVDCVV